MCAKPYSWKDCEIQFLKDNIDTMTYEELRVGIFKLNKELGITKEVTKATIRCVLYRMNIKKTDEAKTVMREKIKQETYDKWSEVDKRVNERTRRNKEYYNTLTHNDMKLLMNKNNQTYKTGF